MDKLVKTSPLDELRRAIPNLPNRLKTAARFILEHEFDATSRSMRQLALAANLQPTVFVRLARHLGRAGWEDFRNDLIETNRPVRPFSSRLDTRGMQVKDDLVSGVIAADANALTRVDLNDIKVAAHALSMANRIWLVGFRSCCSVAMLLHYQLRLFRGSVHLVGMLGLQDLDFGNFAKGDVVLTIGFAPYSHTLISCVREARRAKCTLISITDNLVVPSMDAADHHILFDAGSTPAFFPSLTTATSIAQALAAEVFRLDGSKAENQLRITEERLTRLAEYSFEKS